MKMIGFVGLGRMGKSMVEQLLERHVPVVVYNRSPGPAAEMAKAGAIAANDSKELVERLPTPRIIWLMLTAGKPVDDMLVALLPLLAKGDIVIDGGNSYFEDSQRREGELARAGIRFLDCGTSGGIAGARHGACMMVGGDKATFEETEWLFKAMCVPDGYGYMGKSGAGHFVKMVHNGIEYGMMQSLAEGMQAIEEHHAAFGTDLAVAARVYAHGSIVESKLATWLQESYDERGYLDAIAGSVPKGETEEEMERLEKLAPMPALRTARLERVQSREEPSYAGKLVSAMRNRFGGHKVNK